MSLNLHITPREIIVDLGLPVGDVVDEVRLHQRVGVAGQVQLAGAGVLSSARAA